VTPFVKIKVPVYKRGVALAIGSKLTAQNHSQLQQIKSHLGRHEPDNSIMLHLDMRHPGKTRLVLEVVLVRPAGVAHPVACVGPNAPV